MIVPSTEKSHFSRTGTQSIGPFYKTKRTDIYSSGVGDRMAMTLNSNEKSPSMHGKGMNHSASLMSINAKTLSR
jgi:hypothetical protein